MVLFICNDQRVHGATEVTEDDEVGEDAIEHSEDVNLQITWVVTRAVFKRRESPQLKKARVTTTRRTPGRGGLGRTDLPPGRTDLPPGRRDLPPGRKKSRHRYTTVSFEELMQRPEHQEEVEDGRRESPRRFSTYLLAV